MYLVGKPQQCVNTTQNSDEKLVVASSTVVAEVRDSRVDLQVLSQIQQVLALSNTHSKYSICVIPSVYRACLFKNSTCCRDSPHI